MPLARTAQKIHIRLAMPDVVNSGYIAVVSFGLTTEEVNKCGRVVVI